MSSVSKNSKISLKRTPRTRRRSRRRNPSNFQRRRTTNAAVHASCSKASRTTKNGGRTCSKVSDKLEALKNLIPDNNGEIVKADQLFQETANYIVRLRTQVFILQRLIQFYGSNPATATTTTSNSTNETADNNDLVS